ncbi:MAG: energy-coupling factor transporter transmembrane protein EcfT, partial [Firmicutes bacterium]|nr:energy-coupling factor transporter transmembrane protein EcfT [Bacillota bacterium]
MAMEARCYRGGDGRTKMKLLHYNRLDIQAFGITAAALAAVILLRSFQL